MIPLRDSIPSRRIPFITYCIIALNAAVFFIETSLNSSGALDAFIVHYGVVPVHFLDNPFLNWNSLVTSQFLHGGFAHILGNMWFLYIFGDNVEDILGHGQFLVFYILSGVAAALAQIYFNPSSQIPMIGASGAIAGVLGAYFIFHPHSRVMTLVPFGFYSRIIEIPAFFFLGFWFIMQTFSGTSALYVAKISGQDSGGVAWWAHAGGFAFGTFIAILMRFL
ncbi:MAG: hypothetical protein A3A86_01025 [Elusimicrobia bacterium RIFCSPLOWO2_01_FULL_60_11]|nr:MAG: hypothetical protein A3A86_01025 [Elusimicrobia bacterium RIFCSPLOWO2_01_FULL_60_11]